MPVHLTLHPDEDVELPDGTRLGDLRHPLTDLTRRPELRHAPLVADHTPVGDDAIVGHRPLLPGATLRVVRTTAAPGHDQDVAALRSPWLLTRTTGSDAGDLVPLAPGAPISLERPGTRVTVHVDARDRVRIRPRTRPGLPRRRPTVALVRTVEGRERRRRLPWYPRRWGPDAVLDLAGTRYALHRSGDAVAWLAPPPPDDRAPSTVGPGMLLTGLVPVFGSIALAVALRQPLYALFSLVAIVALAPQLVAAVRRRRAGPQEAPPPVAPAAGTDPGRTAARAVAAHQASASAWRRALDDCAARARTGPPAPPPSSATDLLPDGALAVRGPAGPARAAVRAVVVDLAATGAAVQVVGTVREPWYWCRWLAPAEPADIADVRVLVVDTPDEADLTAAGTAARRGDVVVLCLPHTPGGPETPSPAWCRATLRLSADGTAHRTAPDGTDARTAALGVSTGWAERTARRLAGLRGLRRCLTDLDAAHRDATTPALPDQDTDPADPRLPSAVALVDLLDTAAPAARWAAARGWQVPVGTGADGGPVSIDLVTDGPHLLIAGTTGAGKSELLQSLVLGLALTRSPDDLALALVDFKGGASFGRCADLPHVVGQVSDLEPGLAGRALAGLRAELHHRERVLAEHRAASLEDAPPGTLPRLVVVIDEFRALADDLPDFLPGLLRVAAQGRSLGVHLVLATQRPAGAISADVRANVSTRIALRVVDAADSHDVVETAAAARIPAGVPGRAVLRTGSAAPVVLQCAHAAGVPDGGPPVVRRVPAWSSTRPPAGRRDGTGAAPSCPRSAPPRTDQVAAVVAGICHAAEAAGHRRGRAPWLPPLPARVTAGDLRAGPPSAEEPDLGGATYVETSDHADEGDALPLALGDDPDRQRRVLVRWRPRDGHLAVLGHARSGRTTTLVALATAALAQGRDVHLLASATAREAFADLRGHPRLGTLAGPDAPRRARRLLHLLERSAGTAGPASSTGQQHLTPLVVVDGVEELRAALSGPGAWDPIATAMGAGGAVFALTGDSANIGGLASRVGPRLVLLGSDPHSDVMLGAPSAIAGAGGPPGRAAWLPAGEPLTCQVLLPEPAGGDGVRATPGTSGSTGGPATAPVRILALPRRVDAEDLVGAGSRTELTRVPGQVILGVGGDDAGPAVLDATAGALVVGPRGAGRSTVLRAVLRALPAGRVAAVVARDEAVREQVPAARVTTPGGARLRRLLDDLGTAGGEAQEATRETRWLVVDDLDALHQTCPVEVERLGNMVEDHGFALVAAATVQGALMAHRGPLAELRGMRTGVVLGGASREADEVFGTPLGDALDLGPVPPGRGALVSSGRAVPFHAVATGLMPDTRSHCGGVERSDGFAPRSVRGVLDDATRHQPEQHHRSEHERDDTADHGGGRTSGEQSDTDEPLEDLPPRDRRTTSAAATPEAAAAARQQPGQTEEEDHDEGADADVRRSAADELDHHRAREDQHRGRFECDTTEDHEES